MVQSKNTKPVSNSNRKRNRNFVAGRFVAKQNSGLAFLQKKANGRWINRDPIGYDGGDNNLYAYVGAMPVNNVAPEGKALATAIIVTITVGNGISRGILTCLNAYYCADCHKKAAKPGKEYGEVCVAAGKHGMKFFVWLITGVVMKYGIQFVS